MDEALRAKVEDCHRRLDQNARYFERQEPYYQGVERFFANHGMQVVADIFRRERVKPYPSERETEADEAIIYAIGVINDLEREARSALDVAEPEKLQLSDLENIRALAFLGEKAIHFAKNPGYVLYLSTISL